MFFPVRGSGAGAERMPAMIHRLESHWPVLDEGAGIAQLLDILARCALPSFSPARDRIGPRRIESNFVPLAHLGEIGTHVIQITFLNLPHTVRSIVRKYEKRKTSC